MYQQTTPKSEEVKTTEDSYPPPHRTSSVNQAGREGCANQVILPVEPKLSLDLAYECSRGKGSVRKHRMAHQALCGSDTLLPFPCLWPSQLTWPSLTSMGRRSLNLPLGKRNGSCYTILQPQSIIQRAGPPTQNFKLRGG